MSSSCFTKVAAGCVFLLVGCTSSGVQTPARSAVKDGSAQVSGEQKHKREKARPPLVAPPPAYGNRVVELPKSDTPKG